MLLEVFMDHRVPYLFIVPLVLGILPAVSLAGIYRRYRMQLFRSKDKKRGWYAKMLERFEEYHRKRAGVVDVKLFVRSQMEDKRFAVLRLRTWEHVSGQAPALCVGLGVAAALYASAQHFPTDYCLELLGYGIVAAIVCRFVQQVFCVSNSRERVELAYRELLENALRPRLDRARRAAMKASAEADNAVGATGTMGEAASVPEGALTTTVAKEQEAVKVALQEREAMKAALKESESVKATLKEQEPVKAATMKKTESEVAKGKQKDEKATRRAEYAALAEEDRLAELRELRLEEIRMRQERRRKEREEREERERRVMEAKAEKERQQQCAKLSEKRRKEEQRAREKQAALQSAYEEKQRRLREKYLGKLQDEYAVSKDRAEQETEIIEDVLKEYLT